MHSFKSKIVTLCLTEIPTSGLIDHVISLASVYSKQSNIESYFIVSKITLESNPYLSDLDNVYPISYSKLDFTNSLTGIKTCLQVLNRIKADHVFVYGENPYHALLSVFYKGAISFNVLDPLMHSGTSKIQGLAYYFSKLIIIFRSKYIFLASPHLLLQLKKAFFFISSKYLENKFRYFKYGNCIQFENLVIPNQPSEKKYDLCYFGRIELYKGIDFLLDVLNELKAEARILRLLIISKQLIPNLPSNCIQIKDYLSHEDLIKHIQSSRFVIMPYLDATGSNAVQISNISGVPIIASDVGCFHDYIVPNINGLLFEARSKEKLRILLSDLDNYHFNSSDIIKYNKDNFSCDATAIDLANYLTEG